MLWAASTLMNPTRQDTQSFGGIGAVSSHRTERGLNTLKLDALTLLCQRDVELASTCLGSLVARSASLLRMTIVSDGSLEPADMDKLREKIPAVSFIQALDLDSRVLPALKDFPHCRKYREWCPWALKLIDIPLYANSDYVYIDGDILFLRDFAGFESASGSQFNLVSMQSYANIYSFAFMDRLKLRRQLPLVNRLNAGFLYVRKAAFDLELIERFLYSAEKHRRPFLSEQTAWAVMAAHTRSGYFSPEQISFPQMALDAAHCLKWRPVAMHFVGGTRHLIADVQEEAKRWESDQPPVELRIEPSRPLTRTRLLLDLCRHRLLVRRCRRAGIFK
jgi:hypothetical protein